MNTRRKNISLLQLLLTVLFVVSLLISNIIEPKQILLPFGIVLTGGQFVFPITYILSDLFSEVYGYKWSRFTCYLAFTMNLFMVLIFMAVIATPYPEYWGNQSAFEAVLGNTPRILFASSLAFIIGDYVNDRVFRKMKNKYPHTHEGFGSRAILSSLCGAIVDCMIFFPIAFYGEMPVETLIITTISQVAIKVGYEIIILPVSRYAVERASEYERGL